MGETGEIRKEVQHFMRECERFFGFAHQNGGLTVGECAAIEYYHKEIGKQVTTLCGNAESIQSQL